MYIKWNDDELIYLIHEGIESARRILYDKYSYLIFKFYSSHRLEHLYAYSDFLQEGLLCLEMAIHRYRAFDCYKFYTFYLNCLKNRYHKLIPVKKFIFQENVEVYDIDSVPSKPKRSDWLDKYLRDCNSLERDLIEFCMLNDGKISVFCEKNQLNYYKTYRLYQKIKRDLEKILTN